MAGDAQADCEAVKKVVRRWARAFSGGDAEGVLAVWDRDYPMLRHQAEEFPDAIRGWDELRHYNIAMMRLASGFRDQSVIDFEADVIGDVAWCYLRGTITFDISTSGEPVTGEARQTFIMRRTADGWKIIHYHESRETRGLRGPLLAAHPRAAQISGNASAKG